MKEVDRKKLDEAINKARNDGECYCLCYYVDKDWFPYIHRSGMNYSIIEHLDKNGYLIYHLSIRPITENLDTPDG